MRPRAACAGMRSGALPPCKRRSVLLLLSAPAYDLAPGRWSSGLGNPKPLTTCREVLLRWAGSAEGFLGMRRTYQASLAAIAVTGYVAGSGDRHMDNYLLSSATGALVPIDFGCAALLMAA